MAQPFISKESFKDSAGASGPSGPGPATGATAGTPGTWTPAGSTPPATPASMVGITASPTTAWTAGQYVQTALAGAPGQTHWTGTAWAVGPATVMEEPAADEPPAE